MSQNIVCIRLLTFEAGIARRLARVQALRIPPNQSLLGIPHAVKSKIPGRPIENDKKALKIRANTEPELAQTSMPKCDYLTSLSEAVSW